MCKGCARSAEEVCKEDRMSVQGLSGVCKGSESTRSARQVCKRSRMSVQGLTGACAGDVSVQGACKECTRSVQGGHDECARAEGSV